MTQMSRDRDKRVTELRREVLKRGFDRHASVLRNISELPGELQCPELAALAAAQSIDRIVAFPPQIESGWQYVPKQALLFSPTEIIHLLASIWPDQRPGLTRIHAHRLMYMRVSLLLLYGYLELVAQGPEQPLRLGVEFNTVAWHHLALPLQRALQVTAQTASASKPKTTDLFNGHHTLDRLPLKFANGVKIYGLLPGEQIEELVFQPGLWNPWLFLFRRPVTPSTLLLLSGNFLVVIQESLRVPQGWILTYIPRGTITELHNHPRDLYDRVVIYLKREEQIVPYELLLRSEAAREWQLCWTRHSGKWRTLPAPAESA